MRRVLRAPALHFVVLGGLLFLAVGREAPAPDPVVITADQVRRLQSDFADQRGRPPTAAETQALVDDAIDDALLYREARALRLEADDRAIRGRLLKKMRAVGGAVGKSDDALVAEAWTLGFDDDVVVRRVLREKMRLLLSAPGDAPPGDDELRAWLAAHAAAWRVPATVSFTQVFVRDPAAAGKVLAALRAGRPAEDAGDPFPTGAQVVAQPRAAVASRFGEALAAAVETLPPGVWSGPYASPFGAHLVRVDARTPARAPELAEVRRAVAYEVREAAAARRLRAGLDRLRARYGARVEWPAEAVASP